MSNIQYPDEEDIRAIVEQECDFRVEDHGIGCLLYTSPSPRDS